MREAKRRFSSKPDLIVPALCAAWVLGLGCRTGAARGPEGSAAQQPAAEAAIDSVIYQVTGGFAGFDFELQLEKGGAIVVQDRGETARRGRLADEGWLEIVALVDAAELEKLSSGATLGTGLAAPHGREGDVADAMLEVVTVNRGGRSVRVESSMIDSMAEPPEGFRDLTRRLMEIAHSLPAEPQGP